MSCPTPNNPHILARHIPKSWFHSQGIKKVVAALMPRLPDVAGKLFLTLTCDPSLEPDPERAFKKSRDRVRRVFHLLRKGVEWEGKVYRIDAPYCVKLEFHQDGRVHYHCIFLTNRFLPNALLEHLWGYGFTNVKRIQNKEFHYLLKYVTKGGDMPEWAKDLKRIRVFQSSRGFLHKEAKDSASGANDAGDQEDDANEECAGRTTKKRASYTYRERFARWARTATYIDGDRVRTVYLAAPFEDLLGLLALSVARAGRYLGNGRIQIKQKDDIHPWMLLNRNQPMPGAMHPSASTCAGW